MTARTARTSTGTLLSNSLADPKLEAARQRALKSYVEGRASFAEAEARVRRAIDKAAVDAAGGAHSAA